MLRTLYLYLLFVTVFGWSALFVQNSLAEERKDPSVQRKVDALQLYKPGEVIYDGDGREVGVVLDVLEDSKGNALVRLQPGDYPGLERKEPLMATDGLKPRRNGGGYTTFLTPDEILQLPEARAGSVP